VNEQDVELGILSALCKSLTFHIPDQHIEVQDLGNHIPELGDSSRQTDRYGNRCYYIQSFALLNIADHFSTTMTYPCKTRYSRGGGVPFDAAVVA